MSFIYCVAWEQSGDFNLSAVVIANEPEQAVNAVSMYEPENIRCIQLGIADVAVNAAQVVCQESL